jgi:23S rRNA pseudouridine1911/1915/1917 synthase
MSEALLPVQHFTVSPEEAGERLDRYLAARLPGISRTRIQERIAEGGVLVGGRPARASHRLEPGDAVEIQLAEEPPREAAPEAIPLDILYEDGDLIAVNKPAGIIVHPGAGVRSGTVANALLGRYGRLSTVGGPERPGIVHRLDKGTSGVLLVARNDEAHRRLVREFVERRVEKTYLALVHGRLEHATGQISLAVARDLRRRTRMTTRRREGRQALTSWRVLARLGAPQEKSAGESFTLVEADLHTGRTHQIRVHFSAMGHPVVGDALYGAARRLRVAGAEIPSPGRPWLHAARVRLAHPRTGAPLDLRAPLPAELRRWLLELAERLGSDRTEIDRILQGYL